MINLNFRDLINAKKNQKILIAGLIVLGIIIFLSTFISGNDSNKEINKNEIFDRQELTNEDYKNKMQNEILEIVKKISGVGEVDVLVTLANGVEYIYASEDKISSDESNSSNETSDRRLSSEKRTIIVEDEKGNDKALIQTTREPVVKGVVVVCEGGADILVQEKVTQSVKVALGISSNRVYVTN